MSSRRTMVLVAAIAMGVLAAYVLRGYVNDQEAKANPDPVKVYMITQPIKRGDPYSASLGIKETTIPKKYQPATFVPSLDALANKVAATDLAANQVLVDNMFVSSEFLVTGLADKLADGMVAIAVPIEGVRALGGLLQPGDKVNIMVLPKAEGNAAGGASEGAAGATTATPAAAGAVNPTLSPYLTGARYLYQQVRIISIGTSVRASASEAVASTAASNTLVQSGGSIVFEVPPDAAQIIASIDPSTLYLTLTKKAYVPEVLAPLKAEDVKNGAKLPGEDPTKLTPNYSGASGAAPTTTKAN